MNLFSAPPLPIKKSLPYIPSELITIALEDLEWVEKNRRYAVKMNHWHSPLKRGWFFNTPCKVCLAGAVMAHSLGIETDMSKSPSFFPTKYSEPLYAIDRLRCGDLSGAFVVLRLPLCPDLPSRFDIPYYSDDPVGFKFRLSSMARSLASFGY